MKDHKAQVKLNRKALIQFSVVKHKMTNNNYNNKSNIRTEIKAYKTSHKSNQHHSKLWKNKKKQITRFILIPKNKTLFPRNSTMPHHFRKREDQRRERLKKSWKRFFYGGSIILWRR